jgi:hypothetical protein
MPGKMLEVVPIGAGTPGLTHEWHSSTRSVPLLLALPQCTRRESMSMTAPQEHPTVRNPEPVPIVGLPDLVGGAPGVIVIKYPPPPGPCRRSTGVAWVERARLSAVPTIAWVPGHTTVGPMGGRTSWRAVKTVRRQRVGPRVSAWMGWHLAPGRECTLVKSLSTPVGPARKAERRPRSASRTWMVCSMTQRAAGVRPT